jgi:nicotinamidase-related amidase
MARVLPVVVALSEHAAGRTVFTRFMPPERAEDAPGRWRAYYRKWPQVTRANADPDWFELVPALRRFVPPADVVDKPGYSAFTASELLPCLQRRGVDTLIVTGSETDVCVLASALAAIDHGFRVIVARGAVCSSSDATQDALLTLYAQRFDVQLEPADVPAIMDAWKASA